MNKSNDSILFSYPLQLSLDTTSFIPSETNSPYSPSTRFHFQISARDEVAFHFFSLKDSTKTKPIIDTLEVGNYYLTLGTNNMDTGVYLWKKQIGHSIETKKFLLIK